MSKSVQAVILAAGKSTRMWPLTTSTPKPLLKIIDKTIIELTLGELLKIPEINEVLVVVNYQKEKIINKLGDNYKRIKIKYITQDETNGSGGALLACQQHLTDRFVVLNGDDLYRAEDIVNCLKHNYAIATTTVKDPQHWGIINEQDGIVSSIIEKPIQATSNKANIGLYVMDKKIFQYQLTKTERGEYEITDYVKFLLQEKKPVNCITIPNGAWLPIGYPWQYLEACQNRLKNIEYKILGEVEDYVTIKGPVFIGKGTIIKSFSYIEGPTYIGSNCIIEPNTHIRPGSIIFDDVSFGGELIESVVMNRTKAKHQCYIGYSVIGKNCNIGFGTVTADLRNDEKDHVTIIKGKKVNTNRKKLGAFLGEKVKTGVKTIIYPGRKIGPKKTTLPGEVIIKDIE